MSRMLVTRHEHMASLVVSTAGTEISLLVATTSCPPRRPGLTDGSLQPTEQLCGVGTEDRGWAACALPDLTWLAVILGHFGAVLGSGGVPVGATVGGE